MKLAIVTLEFGHSTLVALYQALEVQCLAFLQILDRVDLLCMLGFQLLDAAFLDLLLQLVFLCLAVKQLLDLDFVVLELHL